MSHPLKDGSDNNLPLTPPLVSMGMNSGGLKIGKFFLAMDALNVVLMNKHEVAPYL